MLKKFLGYGSTIKSTNYYHPVKQSLYGLKDEYGNIVVKPTYDVIYDFVNGIARVSINKKYGFINEYGDPICNVIYDKATDFKDGYARVSCGGRESIIDKYGHSVLSSDVTRIGKFINGYLPALIYRDGKQSSVWSIYDKNFNVVVSNIKLNTSGNVISYEDGLFLCCKIESGEIEYNIPTRTYNSIVNQDGNSIFFTCLDYEATPNESPKEYLCHTFLNNKNCLRDNFGYPYLSEAICIIRDQLKANYKEKLQKANSETEINYIMSGLKNILSELDDIEESAKNWLTEKTRLEEYKKRAIDECEQLF